MEGFVDALAGLLEPGASFAIDSGSMAESVFPNFQPASKGEIGGIGFEARRSYDPRTAIMTSRYRFTRHGQTVERSARHLVFTLAQLVGLFARHGFVLDRAEGGLEGEPFGLVSGRLLAVARRI
jgi:hypothetical protein